MFYIFGNGGLSKEVRALFNIDVFHNDKNFISYVDLFDDLVSNVISENSFMDILSNESEISIFASIAIGSPRIKESIYSRFVKFDNLKYINISYYNDIRSPFSYKLGVGNFIFPNSVISQNVIIGNFCLIYYGCTIGHDSIIDDFVTLSPGCNISGNVTLEKGVFVGAGAVILEELSVCSGAVIGAGAVVINSITKPGTYVGIPAKLKIP
jgi:sugar O-acyltransferase (sialic acid O-acetyltransferase NeuD family)